MKITSVPKFWTKRLFTIRLILEKKYVFVLFFYLYVVPFCCFCLRLYLDDMSMYMLNCRDAGKNWMKQAEESHIFVFLHRSKA